MAGKTIGFRVTVLNLNLGRLETTQAIGESPPRPESDLTRSNLDRDHHSGCSLVCQLDSESETTQAIGGESGD